MDSTDLLKELQLDDYYPQKLSFSEAIRLRGKFKNGQYGLEIVRRLLMFDSQAVVSIAAELNKRHNNTNNKESDAKVQSTADGSGAPKQSSVKPSWISDRLNAEQSEQKFHPMDLLVVLMNCCDNFLRQVLVEKMFVNKLSIPILLPDISNGSYTLLLFALESLIPEVQDLGLLRERSASLTDTLMVYTRNPIVSFIRVGGLHRSKSKLINELLGFNSFNTFFGRECPNGSAKRLVSNGSIEAAWFQSSTAEEGKFNCRLLTALNLRGNAKDYPKQTQFLCESSTLVVFMVESLESFMQLYEKVIKSIDLSQTKIIVCYISFKSPDEVEDTHFAYLGDLKDRGIISEVIYDWHQGTKQMSDVDLTIDLRKSISDLLFRPKRGLSNKIPTYASIIRSGKNSGFLIDEDNSEYKTGKSNAGEFIRLICNLSQDCKPMMLPLQGEPLQKLGVLEREQRGKSNNTNRHEHFIAEKEEDIRRQREIQCQSLIKQSDTALNFFFKFSFLEVEPIWYCLNCCRLKLDAQNRFTTSRIMEEYETWKQEQQSRSSNGEEIKAKVRETELKIANSVIGVEHILRELGQMYEAVISEETRMKKVLDKAVLNPNVIRRFPAIMASLLLKGQPLELMDGDTSSVPITWLKAILREVRQMTDNARVFVLSIIGVQSSGKSTLLNALFGLQFPVSAGRCTKGIYCHLVPIDKGSLRAEFDYVLVVDTEGLGSSEFTTGATVRDNELATFAIGLADATIINMKGENWAELKDILQIVAHGLIRVRKTKAELQLMPRCMFVHQNVPAVDAKQKNQLGQQKQLTLLDEAINMAGHKEGSTEITRFDQVIHYDPFSHSWYFPDLWTGKPPKAKVSQDYIGKANELRQHLMEVMRNNPSKLTISGFFLRMSDLWNAMLHNDFVLCFRNTQQILLGTALNDRISHDVDSFKNRNKVVQTTIRDSICSFTDIDKFRAEKENKLREMSDTIERNFADLKATLQAAIAATDICADLKQKYESSLHEIRNEEIRRIQHETEKDLRVHMKKLEIGNDQSVKDLKAKVDNLEKCTEETEKDRLNKTDMKAFEDSWDSLVAENKMLVDKRTKSEEERIKKEIIGSAARFDTKEKMETFINNYYAQIFKSPLIAEIPEVTQDAFVKFEEKRVVGSVWSKSPNVYKVNFKICEALEKWNLQFQSQSVLELDASHLEQFMSEVAKMIGISRIDPEGCLLTYPQCSILPSGYRFTRDYSIKFLKFAFHYIYNRFLENSLRFISMTDPLADICERQRKSISCFRMMIAEANIDTICEQIFEYAKCCLVRNLGELIKAEVIKEDNRNATFKSKREFLKKILTNLGEKMCNLTDGGEEKKNIFKNFMLYIEMAESQISEAESNASEDFFLDAILKLLQDMLISEGKTSETDFQRMVKDNVGTVVEKAKNALKQAETDCNGSASEYVRIFKDNMHLTGEIYLRINSLDGFTETVLGKIDSLYTDYLSQANSSFEVIACEDNRAAIRPLFEKIMGCRERCPFCSAPCSQSLQQHGGDHRASHYPMGVRGTVDIWGLFTDTQETSDAADGEKRKPRELALDTCQTMVGTRKDIRTKVTVKTYTKWYHRMLNWNYHSFKNYKELEEYKDWDIPSSGDPKTSLYWKWFMAQFVNELAEHYDAKCPKIPEGWKQITWEEANESLDSDLSVEENLSSGENQS